MNQEADHTKRTMSANEARFNELVDDELAKAETPDLDAIARAVLERCDDDLRAVAARIGARRLIAEEAAKLFQPSETESYVVQHDSGVRGTVDLIAFDEPDRGVVGWVAHWRGESPDPITAEKLSPTADGAMEIFGQLAVDPPPESARVDESPEA